MAVAIPAMGWLVDRPVPAGPGWRRCGASPGRCCVGPSSVESLIAFRVLKARRGSSCRSCRPSPSAAAGPPAGSWRSASWQLAPIVGPAAGGAVLSSLGWRWLFLVNAGRRRGPRHRPPPPARHRPPGAHPPRPARPGPAAPGRRSWLAGCRRPLGRPDRRLRRRRHRRRRGAARRLRPPRSPPAERALDVRLLRVGRFGAATVPLFLFGVSLYGPLLVLPLSTSGCTAPPPTPSGGCSRPRASAPWPGCGSPGGPPIGSGRARWRRPASCSSPRRRCPSASPAPGPRRPGSPPRPPCGAPGWARPAWPCSAAPTATSPSPPSPGPRACCTPSSGSARRSARRRWPSSSSGPAGAGGDTPRPWPAPSASLGWSVGLALAALVPALAAPATGRPSQRSGGPPESRCSPSTHRAWTQSSDERRLRYGTT